MQERSEQCVVRSTWWSLMIDCNGRGSQLERNFGNFSPVLALRKKGGGVEIGKCRFMYVLAECNACNASKAKCGLCLLDKG